MFSIFSVFAGDIDKRGGNADLLAATRAPDKIQKFINDYLKDSTSSDFSPSYMKGWNSSID